MRLHYLGLWDPDRARSPFPIYSGSYDEAKGSYGGTRQEPIQDAIAVRHAVRTTTLSSLVAARW